MIISRFIIDLSCTHQLDDVEAGGATAFTHAGVTVWPKKGKSVFWWNLNSDLSGDTLTRHGGCPVLHGSKWSMICFDHLLFVYQIGNPFLVDANTNRPQAYEKQPV